MSKIRYNVSYQVSINGVRFNEIVVNKEPIRFGKVPSFMRDTVGMEAKRMERGHDNIRGIIIDNPSGDIEQTCVLFSNSPECCKYAVAVRARRVVE